MTEAELAEIEQRAMAATEGPWGYKAGFLKHYVFSMDAGEDLGFALQELHHDDGRLVPAAENALFIAHARTDIPRLVAEVRRQLERVAELEAEVAALRTANRDYPPARRIFEDCADSSEPEWREGVGHE